MHPTTKRNIAPTYDVLVWLQKRPRTTLTKPLLAIDVARQLQTKPSNVRQAFDMLGYRSAKFKSEHKGSYQYREWYFHPDVPVARPPMGRPTGAFGIVNRTAYEFLAAHRM
jgi:hypothetical protein